MTDRLELPPINVITDYDVAIPNRLLRPHYDDPRFRQKNVGRVIFLASGVVVNRNGSIEEAQYINSDTNLLWSSFGEFGDRSEDSGLVPNSARFFEAALNDLLPRLHQNYPVVSRFGRNIPKLRLQAITSGINGSNLHAFNEFAVVPGE